VTAAQAIRPSPACRLVVAGYTGRDAASVRAHIEELAAIGVPRPPRVPAFYQLDPGLLSTGSTATVTGGNTSGEVEPVLIRRSGRYWLTVGSDHTDRDLERTDIQAAKAACPKPIARTALPLGTDLSDVDWDGLVVTCHVDGRLYQRGELRSLRTPADLLAELTDAIGHPGDDLVVFGGTVPLLGGRFVAGTEWVLRLTTPAGDELMHTYRTERKPT
jgi:4-hydroxyphenylacetate 3-monooxygenase